MAKLLKRIVTHLW